MESESKYFPGKLHIVGFDYLGTRLFSREAENQTYVGAIEEGNRKVEEGVCKSFCILRAMYNSEVTAAKRAWSAEDG